MVAIVMAVSKLNGPLPAWLDWTFKVALPVFIVVMIVSLAQIGMHRRRPRGSIEKTTPPENSQNKLDHYPLQPARREPR